MNRRDRRATIARSKTAATSAAPVDIAELMVAANRACQQGHAAQAEDICQQILARAPGHATCLNLLGVTYQASGRHRLAIKQFAKAIAVDDLDAGFHYNIACSYQLSDQSAAATTHFRTAITLGLSGKSVVEFVLQNKSVVDCLNRLTDKLNGPVGAEYPFAAGEIDSLAKDIFLRCVLESSDLRSLPLELLLTHLRRTLLRLAHDNVDDPAKVSDDVVGLFCALAQQCFITEYIFPQSDEEARQVSQLRDLLSKKSESGGRDISALVLAAVAAYFPLHSLASAKLLLNGQWPVSAAELLRQQVREPLEEINERSTIPALTSVDDATSMQVMQQYEENPYPRWTMNPFALLAGDMNKRAGAAGSRPAQEILVAGCGTGKHAIRVAQFSPEARVLAVDISRPSLAYARRKTREQGLQNIEYAQADILKIGAIGRTFDRIEAVGVLHHLSDPQAGWRVLLSLLRPNGVMRLGLYSDAGRRVFADARALIAERGYHATPHDIRAFRQTIIRNANEPRWSALINTADFYYVSGCRDLLFHVMEHQFEIPQIASFLAEQGLTFLGFELEPNVVARFQQNYPDAQALVSLDCWHAFEAAHPETFLQMYRFVVRKKD